MNGGATHADIEPLQALIDRSSDALALIDPGTLEYLHFNEAAARLPQPDRATLQQRCSAAIAAYPQAVTDREDRPQPEGRRVVIERRMRAIRPQGRWLVVAASRDITDRLAARDSVERLRTAADQAGDAIVLIDYDTLEYLEVNQTSVELFGYPKEQLLQMGPGRVTRLGDERLREAYTRLIESPSHTAIEEMLLPHADGRLFHAEVSARAVQSGGRWVVIACIRDVTRRKLAEDALAKRLVELQRSNEELERFAYVASHDLAEPLRMITSYVQLLRRRYEPLLDADGRDFIQFAVDGAERMKTLLDDLLVYSRAGRTLKPLRPLDLHAMMSDVKDNLQSVIGVTGATIEVQEAAAALGDRASVTQVLQHLVANAIRFMPRGRSPVVRVTCTEDASGWTMSVADNGIGIEERYFERIFLVFQRLNGRGEYPGNGIGLAVCKKIVERYGGCIWVESTPGQGSTFRFTLPRPSRDIVR
jgi:PAS domain S-box-containing protein